MKELKNLRNLAIITKRMQSVVNIFSMVGVPSIDLRSVATKERNMLVWAYHQSKMNLKMNYYIIRFIADELHILVG